jgi:hypothetical protein
MSSTKPILVIDDEPNQVRAILLELAEDTEIVHPEELTDEHLHGASLLLVDHHLGDINWPKRSNYPLACRPKDGLALAAILQSNLRDNNSDHRSPAAPVAVALLSAKLTDVTGLDNPPEHISARACGLDWAFAKFQNRELANSLPVRIRSFANAVRTLPQIWPTDPIQSHNKLTELLGIQDTDWAGIALLHVDRCHPPVHEPAFWTHGTGLLRWLAQQILPYRTFVLDRHQLAVRLGVTPRWLLKHLSAGSPLLEAIASALYRGILQELMGPRWWVAGIDTLLWNVTDGGATGVNEVRQWLKQHTGEEPDPLSGDETLILNQDLCFDGSIARYSDCVKVWPDDWPAFAEIPWTTIAQARSISRLSSLVMASDMENLVTNET